VSRSRRRRGGEKEQDPRRVAGAGRLKTRCGFAPSDNNAVHGYHIGSGKDSWAGRSTWRPSTPKPDRAAPALQRCIAAIALCASFPSDSVSLCAASAVRREEGDESVESAPFHRHPDPLGLPVRAFLADAGIVGAGAAAGRGRK